MSQHLASMQIGDTIDMRGPVGGKNRHTATVNLDKPQLTRSSHTFAEFEYLGVGKFKINDMPHHVTKFNMVAGGTGITPCYQVIDEILRSPSDTTQISLIFACNDVNDLLCRSTLDRWAKEHPDRFAVTYILASPTESTWQGPRGFVNLELFKDKFFPPNDDVFILMCGPPIMLERACYPNFEKLGFDTERMFGF
jgi:NAD(P)H-flavin reductase